jgi:hypothetical protein
MPGFYPTKAAVKSLFDRGLVVFGLKELRDVGLGFDSDNSYEPIVRSPDGTISIRSADDRIEAGEKITLPSGNAPLPALTFTVDLNTGFYRAGADIMGYSVGGTKRAEMSTSAFILNGISLYGQLLNVSAKTANYTVLTTDSATVFTNEGAAGAVTFALPAATVGLNYRFQVMAAQELRIDPNGTETIALPSTGAQSAAGAYIVADALGEWVNIVCVKAGQWVVQGYNGTWTAV